jgi:hypothetical protein
VEGIGKLRNQSIKIYPNPVENTLYIMGLQKSYTQEIRIIDVLGRTWYQGLSTGDDIMTLHVEKYPSGLYFIRITDADAARISTQTFLKQ